jgi:hypothetical protein
MIGVILIIPLLITGEAPLNVELIVVPAGFVSAMDVFIPSEIKNAKKSRLSCNGLNIDTPNPSYLVFLL